MRLKSEQYKQKISLTALRGPRTGFINSLAQRVALLKDNSIVPPDALGDEIARRRVELGVPTRVRTIIHRQFGHSDEADRIMHGYVSQESLKERVIKLCKN